MPIQWEQMMVEFDQMKEVDQLRAVTKEQMKWLTEVAEKVPCKEALDLGFGCGFSAVAMMRGVVQRNLRQQKGRGCSQTHRGRAAL